MSTPPMTPTDATTLGEALPAEIARIRDEVIPIYQSIGPNGAFAIAMMRRDLNLASKAMIECDLPAMIRAYAALTGYKL